MHGRIDKIIVVNSFENIPKIEEMKQDKKTLVKEDCFFVLALEKETFFHVFHDPMAHYMENFYNQNLQRIVGCKLKDKGSDESMSVLNMGRFTLDDVLQPWLSYVLRSYYFHTSQQTYQFLDGNQQVKSHEKKNAVEGVKHDGCFVHILEDPFSVLFEAVNSPNFFDFLRFGFMDEFLNDLSVKMLWNKQVQRKQTMDKMLSWLHWNYDFT
jgi:hypothetical protein